MNEVQVLTILCANNSIRYCSWHTSLQFHKGTANICFKTVERGYWLSCQNSKLNIVDSTPLSFARLAER